ncbi:MAG: hypothetical protein WB607_10535, partial [Candidatus Acidiferrum sp.]
MRKLAGFVQLNCTSSISIANFRLQARVINSVYKGFDAVNNDDHAMKVTCYLIWGLAIAVSVGL